MRKAPDDGPRRSGRRPADGRHVRGVAGVERRDTLPNLPGGVETSLPIEGLRDRDPQEARAVELEALGLYIKAERVRGCRSPLQEYARTCKVRGCPGCAARTALGNRTAVVEAIRGMRRPVLVLVSLASRGLHDLRATMRELRALLQKLRRARLRSARAATGLLEPKLARRANRWIPHAHLVLDLPTELSWAHEAREWRRLTVGRGSFKPDPAVDVRSPEALALYITKGSDACPPPGTLAPVLLNLLWAGIHGLQLPINWGSHGRRGRRNT